MDLNFVLCVFVDVTLDEDMLTCVCMQGHGEGGKADLKTLCYVGYGNSSLGDKANLYS